MDERSSEFLDSVQALCACEVEHGCGHGIEHELLLGGFEGQKGVSFVELVDLGEDDHEGPRLAREHLEEHHVQVRDAALGVAEHDHAVQAEGSAKLTSLT